MFALFNAFCDKSTPSHLCWYLPFVRMTDAMTGGQKSIGQTTVGQKMATGIMLKPEAAFYVRWLVLLELISNMSKTF